jgi:hypothetical protein
VWLVRFLFQYGVFVCILAFGSSAALWWRLAAGPALAGIVFATIGDLVERRRTGRVQTASE